jgi:Skp family chaperone for outer membrane proteins
VAQAPTAQPSPTRPATSGTTSAAPGGLKIAFISSRTILDSTPGYAAAESTFFREFQGMRDEVQKLQQQLDSAVQSFDQASIALSPAAKDAKRRDLQQMQDRMTQRSNALDSRARARNQELLGPYRSSRAFGRKGTTRSSSMPTRRTTASSPPTPRST